MILLVYEGALRKWFLPGMQAQLYILKDFILLAAYTGFYFSETPKLNFKIAKATIFFMVSCTGLFLVLILNPNSPSIALGVLGFKNYVFYFPLIFIVPHCFGSYQDFVRKLRAYMFFILPAIIICYVQFVLPPSHWLNGYVLQSTDAVSITSQFGGDYLIARTAGTFSFLSGNATFLTAMFALSLGMMFASGFKFNVNDVFFWTACLSFGAVFTTGSRFAVLSLLFAVVVILGVALIRGLATSRVILKVGLSISFFVVAIYSAVPLVIIAFTDRLMRVSDSSTRIFSPFFETIHAFQNSGLIGTGLATTHGGLVPLVMGRSPSWDWLNNTFVEVELARVMLETGLLGFVFYYGLRISILVMAYKCSMLLRSRSYIAISSAITYWAAIHMVQYIAGNPTAALYFYFATGVLIKMSMWESSHIRKKIA